ncbi:MAG: metalloprotease protein [Deltaproteobacteria bacterium]|nr:metalloprotease protein [Deltaproteobacteria bacterium]
MIRDLLVISTCIVAIAFDAGCAGGDCGVGTVRYGDTCLAVDPFDKTPPKIAVDPPRYTRDVGTVRLMADEPATIYYAIDGTQPTLESPHEPDSVVIPNVPDDAQLRYFAVDLAGNQSAEELRVWIIDREGPGAPIDFRASIASSTRTVTWTPPPDPRFGGIVVVRIEGQLTSSPVSGQAYAVGDTLSPGVTVVALEGPEATGIRTFSETMPARPGLVRYAAWAFDDLYNYGAPAGDYALVPIPAQTGTIAVDATAGTVAVTAAPSFVTLGGTATLAGTSLTVNVTVRNDTTRVLYAPKLLVTGTLPGGITWTNSDGTFATLPYRAYGAAIMPGTTATATWTFDGVASGTILALDLDFRDGRILTANAWDYNSGSAGEVVDAETGKLVLSLAAAPAGQGGGSHTQRGGITPDGRVIVGGKTAGAVSSFDLVTGGRVLTATLRKQKSQVMQVALDRGGVAAYALVADGHPQALNRNGPVGSETELVRLDTATLTERGRLELGISKNRSIEMSPDGKTLLIATGLTAQGVIVVDLATFTIKHRILTEFRPQVALFAPVSIEAGPSIVVVGEQIAIFTPEGVRTAMYPTPGVTGKVLRAAFGTPNVLWVGRRTDLANIDLSTSVTQVIPTTTATGRMLEVFDGKVHADSSTGIKRLDATGTVELALPGFTYRDGHWIGRSPF